MVIKNFVNNEFTDSQNKTIFTTIHPFTREKLHTVTNSEPLDLVYAIQSAQKAYLNWKDSTIADRLMLLGKIKSYIGENKNKFIEAESLDQGLPTHFTEVANIQIALQKIDLFQIELNEQKIHSSNYSPVGVVAVILSWNLSTRVFVEKVIPAMLAGNAVIVKTSSASPITGQLWAELLQNIACPAGLVQILNSQNSQFAQLMVQHPGIKALVFTGELDHLSQIIKTMPHKKIMLGAGAKNPAVVLKNTTETEKKEIIDSFMLGQGQLHWNSSRLFILEKFQTNWVGFIENYLEQLTPSEGIHDQSSWTPLIKNKYITSFGQLMTTAKSDQAKLLQVQKNCKDHFVKPFFTQDMSNCSTLQQDQVMAPAFILTTVKYPFDVPKYSNVSYYGFMASIWADVEKVDKVSQQLDVGLVSLNRWGVFVDKPTVGVKQSTFGSTDHQIFGTFYSNVKNITL